MSVEQILAAIRALPISDRLRVVEAVVHEVVEDTPPPSQARRPLGIDEGRIWIAEDFDAPLPDEIQRAFDGDA